LLLLGRHEVGSSEIFLIRVAGAGCLVNVGRLSG